MNYKLPRAGWRYPIKEKPKATIKDRLKAIRILLKENKGK
jgi:hypothetical protein